MCFVSYIFKRAFGKRLKIANNYDSTRQVCPKVSQMTRLKVIIISCLSVCVCVLVTHFCRLFSVRI